MITTVCLNPAIDQSAKVDQSDRRAKPQPPAGHARGDRPTARESTLQSCSRRLHAAVDLHQLRRRSGYSVLFRQGMEARGRATFFTPLRYRARVRRNLKIVDYRKAVAVTEFNEQGAEADAAALSRGLTDLPSSGQTGRQPDTPRFAAACRRDAPRTRIRRS